MADTLNPSPFNEDVHSPFGDTTAVVEAQPADNTPTPMRTVTMALAKLHDNQQQLSNADEISSAIDRNVALSSDLIESGQEQVERLKAATNQTMDQMHSIGSLAGTHPAFTHQAVHQIQQSVAYDRAMNVQELSKSAMEDEAIRAAEDYLRHDDWVGFKATINRMDPTKNTSYGVIRDHMVKDLVVSNQIEKAQFDINEETFWHKLITGITSVPESVLLGGMFQQLGNVDDGQGGYHSSFWRFLTPGTEMGNQILAVQGMNAQQLAEYMPKLIGNIKGNSTTLGLTDPGRVKFLLNQFQTGLSKHEQFVSNAFNWADMAAIIPFGKFARGAAIGTELLTGIGARKTAANRVANALEAMGTAAPWEVTAKTAVIPEEIVDHSLPSIINPNKTAQPVLTKASLLAGAAKVNPEFKAAPVTVSLSGDISDTMGLAKGILESDELKSLSSPSRFFTPEEQQTSINAAIEKIEARTQSKVADSEVVPVRLENGQTYNQLDVTINQPFATPEEARGFLASHGYGADVTNVIEGTKPIETKTPGTFYHGSRRDNLTAIKSSQEATGKGNSGIYFTPNKKLAWGYSGGKNERIYSVNLITRNPKTVPTHEMVLMSPDRIEKLKAEGYDSLVNDSGNEYVVFDQSQIKYLDEGMEQAEIIKDSSGQFFPKVRIDVAETGFYTNDLNPPRQSYISRWLFSNTRTLDRRLFEKGTKAGQIYQQWIKMTRDLNSDLRKLGPNDRTFMREIAQKGMNEKKWYSDNEFNTLWERATGSVPSDKIQAAYRQFKIVNDYEYIMRNSEMVTDLAVRGMEHVRFPALAGDVEGFGRVDVGESIPNGRIFNASDGVHYKSGELTPQRLEELRGQGYVTIHMDEAQKLHDGTEIDKFLVKKSDLQSNPIPKRVLNYQEGGHRLYSDKYFVKQAARFKQPDTGEEFLKRPNVYVTAGTKAEAQAWADVMERARLGVLLNKLDAKALDEQVFLGRKGLPSGQDFLKGIEDGTFSVNDRFESTFDRELPFAYQRSEDVSKFAEESGQSGFYRTNGRLYYSGKGDALKRVDGALAPTLDPFKAQNQALYNVARLSSFEDFKTASVHRWVNTYHEFLNIPKGADPSEAFNGATVKRGVDPSFANEIEGQRAAVKRILNFRSDFDLHYQNFLRKSHEWIVGDSDNALRQAVSKAPLYLLDHNPVNFLRGIAFDMKLGMLNIGQFFIQTSTMASALALSPSAGLKGIGSVAPMLAYRAAKKLGTQENVLDLMAKRGMGELAGFKSAKEFKDYIRYIDRSGFFAFGDSHLLVNASGPAPAYAILDKVHSLRTMGRFFFNEAENWNRLTAIRIAYDEAKDRFGKVDFNNFEFDEFLRGRAENYSFNMSQTSQAAWQKGLLSVPTQFWAYNLRMFEALTGKQFTAAQKLRLGLAQLGMAGTAGLPVVGAFTDFLNHKYGVAPRLQASDGDPRGQPTSYEQNMATLQRGLVDRLIFEATGADVQAGQRLGTGDFFTQTAEKLMGFSEYGKTSFADIAGGATYSIMGETLGSAFAIVGKWMSAETGGNDVSLSRFEWEDLFRQVSTINNVYFKAWFAHNYGIYQSMKGQTLVNDLPPADAPFVALGFAPGELRDREAIMAWREHRADTVKDSADFINRLWAESVRQPDKMEQNTRIVNEYVNMLPDAYKLDVLRKAHLERDPSDYDRLLRIRERQTTLDNLATEEPEEK